MHGSRLIQSITTLYLPEKDISEELARIENAPCIKGTVDVYKVKREKIDQGLILLEFYRLLFDEKLFYTHFYQKYSDPIVYGHESFEEGPNRCPHCLIDYHVGKEWMECPVCKHWYCSEYCFSG